MGNTTFDSRFLFSLYFEDNSRGEKNIKKIYDFSVNKPENYSDKKTLDILLEEGVSRNENGIFKNSNDIVEMSNSIRRIFMTYLKTLSIDFLDRHKFNYQSAVAPSPSCYTFVLTDLQNPVYKNGKITTETREVELYRFSVNASDFVYNENYNLSILPIWGDFEKVVYDENNYKKTIPQKGIKSIIRHFLTNKNKKYTNRFTTNKNHSNCENLFISDVNMF